MKPIIIPLLVSLPFLQAFSESRGVPSVISKFQGGAVEELSIKDDPKAHGVSLTLKYPKGWRTYHPGTNSGVRIAFAPDGTQVIVSVLPFKVSEEDKTFSKEEKSEVADHLIEILKEGGAKILSRKQRFLASQPAEIIDYSLDGKLAGSELKTRSRYCILFTKGCAVIVTFTTGSKNEDELHIQWDNHTPLFELMADSIKIN